MNIQYLDLANDKQIMNVFHFMKYFFFESTYFSTFQLSLKPSNEKKNNMIFALIYFHINKMIIDLIRTFRDRRCNTMHYKERKEKIVIFWIKKLRIRNIYYEEYRTFWEYDL